MDILSLLVGIVLGGLIFWVLSNFQKQTSSNQTHSNSQPVTIHLSPKQSSSKNVNSDNSSNPFPSTSPSPSPSAASASANALKIQQSVQSPQVQSSQGSNTAAEGKPEPSKMDEICAKIIKDLMEACEAPNNQQTGWATFATKNNVICDKKEIPGMDIPFVRGRGIIKAPPAWVKSVLTDFKHLTKIDSNIKAGHLIETGVGDNGFISYVEYKEQWPTSPRDFVTLRAVKYIPNEKEGLGNSIVIGNQSITHKEAPERKGYVRAEAKLTGYYLRPVMLDGKVVTDATYCALVNLNGKLPSAITNKVANEQPLTIYRVAQYAANQPPDTFNEFYPDKLVSSPLHSSRTLNFNFEEAKATVSTPLPNNNSNSNSFQSPVSPSPSVDDEEDESDPVSTNGPNSTSVLDSTTPLNQMDEQTKKEFARLGDVILKDLLSQVNDSEWQNVGKDKDVQLYSKTNEVLHSFMGLGIVRAQPQAVYDYIRNPAHRQKYDKMLKKIQVVAEIDASESSPCSIVYMKHVTRQCLVKTARDMVVLTRGAQIEGGKYVFAAKSVSTPLCPVDPKVVRAEVESSGWLIEPTKDGKSSLVTYIARVDLKGNLPTSVINLVGKRQPLSVHYIREFIGAK